MSELRGDLIVIVVIGIIELIIIFFFFEEQIKRNDCTCVINHPDIIHEMVHVRIHKKYGFKIWRVVLKNEELICIMTLPKNILLPKYLPKIFLWEITHLIHDLFIRFFILDIINIVVYTKEFVLINRMIIKEMLRKE